MRFLPVFPVMLLLARSAAAADAVGDGGGFSLFSGFVRMIASLAVVVGVIMIFHYLSRRWMKGVVPGSSHHGYIRIVENRFLAPKKSLLLVEVGGEYMLLSSCADTITLVKQIDMIEEVEVIEEMPRVPFLDALQDKIKALAVRLPAGVGPCPVPIKKGGMRT